MEITCSLKILKLCTIDSALRNSNENTRKSSCMNARHTARRTASVHCADLSPDGGDTPSSPGQGVLHPVLDGGGVVPPFILNWGYPHPDLGWGTPIHTCPLSRPRMGYPPSRPGIGYPHLDLGWSNPPPHLDMG